MIRGINPDIIITEFPMFHYQYSTIEKSNTIYQFLLSYIESNLYSPSYSEIRSFCQFKSNKSVIHYLGILRDMGYITFQPNVSRSIALTHFVITIDESIPTPFLSKVDLELYQYLVTYITTNQYVPSYNEMLLHTNMKSKSSIYSHLHSLQSNQLILLNPSHFDRAITLTNSILKEKEV